MGITHQSPDKFHVNKSGAEKFNISLVAPTLPSYLPEVLEVFDNLPNTLTENEKAAIDTFVSSAVNKGYWSGIEEFVCYALDDKVNARTGMKGVLTSSVVYGLTTNPNISGISKVNEGWRSKYVVGNIPSGAVTGIVAGQKMNALFANVPTDDVSFGAYIYSSDYPVASSQARALGNAWHDGAASMHSTTAEGESGGTRRMYFYLQSTSLVSYTDGQLGDANLQKRMFTINRDPSAGNSKLYTNGTLYKSETKTYGNIWRNYSFGLVGEIYQSQGTVFYANIPNATYSFIFWGRYSELDQAELYADAMQLLRDLGVTDV